MASRFVLFKCILKIFLILKIFDCCGLSAATDRIGNAVDVSSKFDYKEVSKCPTGTFKKGLYCVKKCAPGTYGNIASGACQPCDKSCKTCRDGTIPNQCTSCYDNYYLEDYACTLCQNRRRQGPPLRKIRLVSQDNHILQGRVEVFRDSKWGTICDDGWDIKDAHVVCRELLLGEALAAVTQGRLGAGSPDQPIWLSNIKCSGNESRIDSCEHNQWGKHSCGHFEDAGVICSGPDSTRRCVSKCDAGYFPIDNSLKCGVCNSECLKCANTSSSCTSCDGTTFLEGNKCVLSCKEGYYGDAKSRLCQRCDIPCRTCSDSAKKCTGCADNRYLSNNTCVEKCSIVEVSQKRLIRLSGVNRKSSFEGRVEVFRSGEWSTVCDESWDFKEAMVVCRQLNMGRAIRATTGGYFGSGSGRIWYDKLHCNGTESSIFKCGYAKVVWNSRCYHVKDAGVVCSGPQKGNPLTNICVKRCQDGFYKDQSDVCRPCNFDRCATCVGFPFQCTSCSGPKFLKNKNCVEDCGFNSYGHISSRKCKTCDKKCVTCANGKDGKNCTSCSAPLALKDGKCTKSCKPNLYQYMGKCVKSCPLGFYKYQLNATCMLCPQDCFSCAYDKLKSAPKCVLCKPPMVSNDGLCTSNCSLAGKVAFPVSNVTGSVTVRLVNGSDHLEGLLQIYHNGIWGTICDDGWDYLESKVVCKQLNLGTQSSKPLGNIPKGTGKIWLDDMFCTGRESALEECVHRAWGDTNCNHNEDVILRCSGPGMRTCQGMCPKGYFDSNGECKLCDKSCDICKNNATNCLKCASGFYKNGSFCVRSCGKGYFLESTQSQCLKCNATCATCLGDASNCTSCEKDLYRLHSKCLPICDPWYEPREPPDIRLRGTTKDSLEGRVEIFHNNEWGTICDDGWDIRDAIVACRMLNLGNATEAITTARFGPGKGRTWLDDVDCSGNENSLSKCSHRGWGVENCEHSEDAGVRCSGPDHSRDCLRNCGDGYYLSNKTKCGKCSSECKTCEYAANNCKTCEANEYLNRSSHHNTCVEDCDDGFYADNKTYECKKCNSTCMSCVGHSNNCTSCESSKVLNTESNTCVESCKGSTLISGVEDIRLAGTNQTLFGRLEVKFKGQWGTVCDDGFDEKDADVACRQLKLGKHQFFKRSAFYGPGTGRVILDDLQCKGTEKSLFNCRMNPGGIGQANCGHSEDVGVGCKGPDTSKRCIKTCPQGFFKNKNVCKKCSANCRACLGMAENCTECSPTLFLEDNKCVSKCTLGRYGDTKLGRCLTCNANCQTCIDGTRDDFCKTCAEGFVLRDSKCIKDCGPKMWSADVLLPPRPPKPLVRLIGGKTKQEGRVEVLHEGVWGTVCDDQWDLNDASVVCRELGFGKALEAPLHSEFGKGRGVIWMDNVDCYGYETSLTQCRQHGWGVNNCDPSHNEDASVVCDNTTIEDVANNYCRELLPLSCTKESPCFPGVTCVDRSISDEAQSFCKQCPDKFTGDGRVCRVVSSIKPEFENTMPSNITVISGQAINLRCVAKKGETTPRFNAMIQDWAKDGKPLNPFDIKSNRIVVSNGQLVVQTAVFQDAGNYTCTLNNTAGITTGYTFVTIKVMPEITASNPVLANVGETAHITCGVSSFPAANITWKKNGSKVSGSRLSFFNENYTMVIYKVTFEDSGSYECHVANELGKAMSTVDLTIGLAAKFIVEPSDQNTNERESKTLRCEASGLPKPEITWKKDGKLIIPDENHKFTSRGLELLRIRPEDIGYYACIAKNPQRIISSFAAVIRIGAPIIDIPPINMSVLSGANVTFYCQVLGFPKPSIEWRKNGQLQYKMNGNALFRDGYTIRNVQPTDAGRITCKASNEKGTVSANAFLTVDGQTGIYKLSSKRTETEPGSSLSTGAIVAIIVILTLIVLVIFAVVLYRYCSGRITRNADTGFVRYELGSDSAKPSRLTALKFRLRPTSKGTREPVDMYDDIRPFADHDTL